MGFGILLIGYFIAFTSMLTTSYYFGDVIGGLIMLYALSKLSRYSSRFKSAAASAVVFTALSLAGGISFLLGSSDGVVPTFLRVVKTVSVLALHIYIFSAISHMAADADDMKLSLKARRNVIVISAYYAFATVNIIVSNFMNDELMNWYMTVILCIYGIICVVLGSLVIHSAFARLFVVGEEREEPKETKLPFIGTLRRKFYESKLKADEENYIMMKEAREGATHTQSNKKKKSKKK